MTEISQRLEDLEALYGDLREQHAPADLTALRARYDHDHVGFIRDVLHADPWDRQVEIAELLRANPRVAVQSCNGLGKDWLASHLAVCYATMGWYVLITGTTERQVQGTLMDTAYAAWANATPRLPGEFMKMGWLPDRKKKEGILAFTASASTRVRGHHAPKMLAIITEAQGVEGEVYKGIRQCLTGEVTRFLLLGNPDKPEGEFYRACTSLPGWKVVKVSAHEHPNVKAGSEVIPGGVTREFIADQAAVWGTESPEYATSVLGEFPDSTADYSLFPRTAREAAYRRWEAGTPITVADALGLDVGETVDQSVAAVRGAMRIEELLTYRQRDSMLLVGEVRVPAQRWGVAPGAEGRGTFVVDANAYGAGAAQRLREEGFRVIAFKSQYGAPTPTKKQALDFGNLRAAAYWRLKELMALGLELPRDRLLDEEMAATKYTTTPSGKMLIRPKDEVKRILGRSPDRLDAVVLACWEEPRISGLGTQGQW